MNNPLFYEKAAYTDGHHDGPSDTQHLLACLDCGALAPGGDQPGEGNIVAAVNGDALCDACNEDRDFVAYAEHRDFLAEA